MSKLTKEQVDTILKNAPNGANKTAVLDGLILRGYELEGVDTAQARQGAEIRKTQKQPILKPVEEPTLGNKISETFGDIKQMGVDVAESAMKRAENIGEIRSAMEEGKQGDVRSILQTTGQLAGAGADAITAFGKGVVNIALSDKHEKDITDVIKKFGAKVMANPEVQNIINKYNALPPEKQRDIDAVGGVVDLVSNFIGGGAVSKGTDITEAGLKKTVKGIDNTVKAVVDTAEAVIPATKDGFINFVTPNVDESVKTILKTTPTSKFDEVVKVAQNASVDPTKPSTYEFVSKSMTDATKQIDNQVKSLAQQKNTIINKAKIGLSDFTKETGSVILDINRKLKGTDIGNKFIAKLKTVKTKIDADKAIDELQDILYKGNKDMTIPIGSSEDKLLKGILGKYNSTLKDALPSSYSKINSEITNRFKALNILNRSLGEVVDGVPIRGAGLVKQFFSPAGTKTKQLFEYIKKTTGVDLAQDAVLAKYIGEAFGDTKIKSLLEGVPTTKTGAIDRVIDFALEKTGATGALQKAKKSGLIKKARELTVEK